MRAHSKEHLSELNAASRKLQIDETVASGIIDATRLLLQNFYELSDQLSDVSRVDPTFDASSLSKIRNVMDDMVRLGSRLGIFTSDTPYWVSLRELSELLSLRIQERNASYNHETSNVKMTEDLITGLLTDTEFCSEVKGIIDELVELTPLSLASSLSFRNGDSLYAFSQDFTLRMSRSSLGEGEAVPGESVVRSFLEVSNRHEGQLETFRGLVGDSSAIVKLMAFPIYLAETQIACLNVAYLVERRTGERAYRYSSWHDEQ